MKNLWKIHVSNRTLVSLASLVNSDARADVELVDFLYTRFRRDVSTFMLETDKEGIAGSIDLLAKISFLTWFLDQVQKGIS